MFDIEGWISRFFDDYVVMGDDYQVDCPFCEQRIGDPDYKHHLGINVDSPAVHCFRCDYSNNWVGLVMDAAGIRYHEALAELYYKPRMSQFQQKMALLKGSHAPTNYMDDASLPADFISFGADCHSKQALMGVRYMAKRGFDLATIQHYNLGMAASLPLRVVIPVEADYYQARRIVDWLKPKYLNPPSKARDYIFNPAALDVFDEVVVCEGALSSMAVGLNAIALISKEPTIERVNRLLASDVEHFIIALEPKAFASMGKLMEQLYKGGRRVTVWSYSVGDPADPAGAFKAFEYSLKTRVTMMLEGV